jgi:hypothetical protein
VVRAGTGQPVKSTINLKLADDTIKPLGPTLQSGEQTFPGVECVGDMKIQALPPRNPLYDARPGDWFPCQGDPVRLNIAMVGFASITTASFEGYAKSVQLDALLAQAKAADAQGDRAGAALAGNELTALLYQAGATDLAQEFGTMTIASAGDALSDKEGLGDVALVRYDPLQKRYVTSPEAKAALEGYQVKTGLKPTGKWDFLTLNALAKE